MAWILYYPLSLLPQTQPSDSLLEISSASLFYPLRKYYFSNIWTTYEKEAFGTFPAISFDVHGPCQTSK